MRVATLTNYCTEMMRQRGEKLAEDCFLFSWQTGSNLANLISYLSGFNVAAGYKVDPLFSRVPSATYVKEKTHLSPRFLREAN